MSIMNEKIDIINCCRLCLNTKLTFDIHTSKKYINSDLPPLDEIIKELTTIQIEKPKEKTNISNNICFSCNYLIIKLYSFRQQSIISNEKFQEAVKQWKKDQENQAFGKNDNLVTDNETKNSLFGDSLVPIYAKCLNHVENKHANNKSPRNTNQTCKLPDKNNITSWHTSLPNSISDPVLSIAFDEHILCSGSNDSQICSHHPSVNRIIEENPNIILPNEALNYNFNCSVVVETFKQLFREALCLRSTRLPHSNETIDNQLIVKSIEDVKLPKSFSKSSVSISGDSCTSSDQISEVTARVSYEQCFKCKRNFPNVLLLEDHVEYCHNKHNQAIVLIKQLTIRKRYKCQLLKSIKLIDNETRISLQYNNRRKVIQIPKLIKNSKAISKTNDSITFKTLDVTESDKFFQKLINDTITTNIPINNISKIPSCDSGTQLDNSLNKSSVINSINQPIVSCSTPVTISSSKEPIAGSLSKSVVGRFANVPIAPNSLNTASIASSTNDLAAIRPSNEIKDKIGSDNIPTVPSLTNNLTTTSVNKPEETYPLNKLSICSSSEEPTVVSTTNNTMFDYETHRKKMLKSSWHHTNEFQNKNSETSHISSSALLCQEYLPLNRPIINNDTPVDNVPDPSHPKSIAALPVSISNEIMTNEILKPNFYVENNVNVSNDNNFKRKSDETSSINPKRYKSIERKGKKLKRNLADFHKNTNIAKKLFVSQLDLEEILRKDLPETDLNEIDTTLVNSAVSAYLRKNPRYFNVLEQLIDIKDLPVVVNVDKTENTFDFIKSKCPVSSDSQLVEMSKINWNNTYVLQEYVPSNKYTQISKKCLLNRTVSVPLSNWKQCAAESLTLNQINIKNMNPESLIDSNPVAQFPSMVCTKNFTNNLEQVPNLSNTPISNPANNQTSFPLSKNKPSSKLVFKRVLKFSGRNEKHLQAQRAQNRSILPKPIGPFIIENCVSSVISLDNRVTHNLYNVQQSQNETTEMVLKTNVENNTFNCEVIEIDDDKDVNFQGSSHNSDQNVLINAESTSLKIVSVMSLNNDYNNTIENTNKAVDNTEKVDVCKSLGPNCNHQEVAPIQMKNIVRSCGLLNAECNSANSNTKGAESADSLEIASSSDCIINQVASLENDPQKSDTDVNKQVSTISVLSPTRINLLLKKNVLKV